MALTKTKLRKIETELIFSTLENGLFDHILEIGSGACIQTEFLYKYCEKLTATDFDANRFNVQKLKNKYKDINFKIADAQSLETAFNEESFDLVFASYLLPHLPDKNKALLSFKKILKDNGLAILVMPNRLQKFLHIFSYYPGLFGQIIRKIINFNKSVPNSNPSLNIKSNYNKNNLNIIPSNKFYHKLFLPIHGDYNNHYKEWVAFSKKKWIKLINNNGLKVIKVVNLKVVTGNFKKTRYFCEFLEKIHFSSSNAYVCIKNNS